MSFSIRGWGTAVPEFAIAQDQAAEWTSRLAGHDEADARRLAALFRRTGIRERRAAILDNPEGPSGAGRAMSATTRWRMERYDELIRPLARSAASRALAESGADPSSITHLVTVSCTGFSAPGFDLDLIAALGLDPGVQRTHVGFMGCHGALNGLRVARALAESVPQARVLLCAAEICSLHFREPTEPEAIVANSLFADGAAAVVGWAEGVEERDKSWRVIGGGSYLVPESGEAMSWRIGDRGFAMTLSPRVSGIIGQHLGPWMTSWLKMFGLSIADVGCWAVHPGGPRILTAFEESVGLGRQATEVSRGVFAEFGNMSSPTVLFILDRLRRGGSARPCVALAFGPGLAIEATLFG